MTTDENVFNSECKKFPKLNHKACELNPEEYITAKYFKSRGLKVEKLCAVKSNENVPDFRLTDNNDFVCLCEIKKPESPMGNLTDNDRRFANRADFDKFVEDAIKQNATPIVTQEQWKLVHDDVSCQEERNTDVKERENARKIEKWVKETAVRKFPLTVIISRNDTFHWTDNELRDFVDFLVDNLKIISNGKIPRNWNKDFHIFTGHYRKMRTSGHFIQNQIQVMNTGYELDELKIDVQFFLGVNWEAVEANCRKAQKQIKSRLECEDNPESVVRLLVMFMEQDIYFKNISEFDKLELDVNRRIFSKFPELSAIAFCENFDPQFASANFRVFHTSNNSIPSLPKNIFNDGISIQFPR